MIAKEKVIVIGAGIAGLTAAYYLRTQGKDVEVLESSSRVGGRMTSDTSEGYIIDRGAQFLSSAYPVLHQLIDQTGLKDRLVATSSQVAFLRNGSLHTVDFLNPLSLATSGFMTWREWLKLVFGSLKMYRDIHKLPINNYAAWAHFDTETADGWYNRNFGTWMTEYFIEPMLEGFYFQSPEETSKALTMAMSAFSIHKSRTMTLKGGIGILPEALAKELTVHLNTQVKEISVSDKGVTVHTDMQDYSTQRVILATPATVAGKLFTTANDLEKSVMDTRYSSTLNISIIMDKSWNLPKKLQNVYGILVPRKERQVISAIGIETNKCPDRSKEGILLNVMLAGTSGARMIDMDEKNVAGEIYPELDRLMPGISESVKFMKIQRWKTAEPISPVGRSKRLRTYRETWPGTGRIILAGDYMGMPFMEGAAESGQWAAFRISGQKMRAT